MALAKLRIEQTGPTAQNARVWLNDVEITNCCSGLKLEMDVGSVTTAQINVLVGELELRGDAVKPEVRDLLEGLMKAHKKDELSKARRSGPRPEADVDSE